MRRSVTVGSSNFIEIYDENGEYVARVEGDGEMNFRALSVDDVKRVYSGRPGCMCGCKGRYFDDSANRARVLNVLQSVGPRVEIGPDDFFCLYAEVEGRRFVAYTNVKAEACESF